MIVHHAAKAALNFIRSLDEVHLECTTVSGEKVTVALPPGGEDDLLNDLEDAVLEQTEHRNKGAAFALDPGAVA